MNFNVFMRQLKNVLGCLILMAWLPAAMAQSGAAMIYVPVGPGSSGDTFARYFSTELAKTLEKPVVVDNRPGAETWIATRTFLNVPANGNALLLISPSSMIITPLLHKELPYDPTRDIRPLIVYNRGDVVLVSAAGSPLKTLQNVLDASRDGSRSLNVGNYGKMYKMGLVDLEEQAKITFSHINYSAPGPAINDLIGGHTDLLLLDLGGALPLIKDGKMHAIATTGKKRSVDLPNTPTLDESGVPGYTMHTWTGFGVRSAVPEAVAAKLESELLKVVATPEFSRFNALHGNAEVMDLKGEQLKAMIETERKHYKRLLISSGEISE